jgi:elongator complex protein 1
VSFTEFSVDARVVITGDSEPTALFVGLAKSGRLHIASRSGHHVLSSNANSFTVSSEFIIYTTTAHEAHFASLSDVLPLVAGSLLGSGSGTGAEVSVVKEWEKRRIERGARIVCAVPSSLSLILQMPRGNLETIAPRPMVLAVVKRDVALYVFFNVF